MSSNVWRQDPPHIDTFRSRSGNAHRDRGNGQGSRKAGYPCSLKENGTMFILKPTLR